MQNSVKVTLVVVLACASAASAEIVMEMVTVGNAGNVADTQVMNDGTTGYGGVDYIYNIGKYEVTVGQYTEFLNAVASTDTHGLYHPAMLSHFFGCKIERTFSASGWVYSVAPDWANRPVSYVSWSCAARFANWLHNGQPTGLQDLGTTEDGAYCLHGAIHGEELVAVTRKPGATWAIPSENEWHKAAYHKNDGATGNYYDYPTSSDSVPSAYLGPEQA